MTDYTENDNAKNIFKNAIGYLRKNYSQFMHLKIYVDRCGDEELYSKYYDAINAHNSGIVGNDCIDSGIDLFVPGHSPNGFYCHGQGWQNVGPTNKIDFHLQCAGKMIRTGPEGEECVTKSGYYLYPRSSLSKTPLRLANSVGIIDAGYRGHIMGMFDLITTRDCTIGADGKISYLIAPYTRIAQICAPGLVPIVVELVEDSHELGSTERGSGGFGSTGV